MITDMKIENSITIKSRLAIARDDWFKSADGKRCLQTEFFLASPSLQRFLKNRLELAFLAGADAQRTITKAEPRHE